MFGGSADGDASKHVRNLEGIVTLAEKMDLLRAQLSGEGADPWRLRLERLRGRVDPDGVERVTTQDVFDVLDVAQSNRTTAACRRLAAVMRELGWTALRVRGLTRGGYLEQVRGYCRQTRP
jgi:hypothetical protein